MKLTNNQIGRLQLLLQQVFYLNESTIWNPDLYPDQSREENRSELMDKALGLFQNRTELMEISSDLKSLYNANADSYQLIAFKSDPASRKTDAQT